MSVSIILIPAAIAAIAGMAAGGAGAAGVGVGIAGAIRSITGGAGQPATMQVRTRMKDRGLLSDALKDLGAVDVEVGDEVAATIDGIKLVMQSTPEGIWAANFTSKDRKKEVTTAEATKLAERLDTAYAARVQTAVATRIREKAGDAGLDLVSETVQEDDSITLTLNVRA
jgi:hypothetical protein